MKYAMIVGHRLKFLEMDYYPTETDQELHWVHLWIDNPYKHDHAVIKFWKNEITSDSLYTYIAKSTA